MRLYIVSQEENDDYDTYSDMVVCAESEDEARLIHPSPYVKELKDWKKPFSTWASDPKNVTVEYIGEAAEHIKKGIVCASFHAG